MQHPFEQFTEGRLGEQVPDSSYVVIADVRKSTLAVRNGRQKDVNMVGAACVSAVRNEFPHGLIPWVFGGDGATFLVPENLHQQFLEVLSSVQRLARVNLNLSLRVGSVSVAELRAENADVRLTVQECGAQEKTYFLLGSGLSLADKIIKARDRRQDETDTRTEVETEIARGMSCRLLPFVSLRGHIYSIIVESSRSFAEQEKLFRQIMTALRAGGQLERLRPLQKENIRRRWIPKTWQLEAQFFKKRSSFIWLVKHYLATLFAQVISKFVFAFDRNNSITGQPSVYEQDMLVQSDWLKFNGALYLVVDMTDDEFAMFEKTLNDMEAAGDILFGIQRCTSALVVCHLDGQNQKRHFHFVDGSDGGLTLAALNLKAKASAKKLSP
jgi:hypothetical protein